jgi:hypothetical protein
MKRDFRLPQHDDSPERAETLKSLRSVYKYRMDYGVPVTDGFRMEDGVANQSAPLPGDATPEHAVDGGFA